jgi:hypothetical protein
MDVDWDDIAPCSGWDDEPADLALVPAEAAVAHELALVSAAPARIAKTKWTVALPCPQQQSFTEQCLAASRMRDHRALQLTAKNKTKVREIVSAALQKFRDAGIM